MKTITAIAVLFLAVSSYAQTPINGATDPNQIPTEVILRFVMNQLTYPEATGVTPAVQYQLHDLTATGLTTADIAILGPILINYRQQLNSLAAINEPEDSFWKGEIALVGSTWITIQNDLSPLGLITFENFLNQSKAGLQLSRYDYGLGTTAEQARKERNMVASMGHAMPQIGGMTPNYSELETLSVVGNANKQFTFNTNGGNINTEGWTTRYGTFIQTSTDVAIAQNGGGGASGSTALAYYSSGTSVSTFPCSQAVLAYVPGNNNSIGVATNISLTSETYYTAQFLGGNGTPTLLLHKVVNGAATQLGGLNYTPVLGDSLALCNNSHGHLSVYLNGALKIYATDTSIGAGYIGIRGNIDENNLGTRGGLGSWSGTVDPTVTITNTVSGTSSCTGPNCTTALHTPGAVVNGVTQQGTPQHPTTFIEAQNSQNFRLDYFDGIGLVNFSAWIDCSAVGPIWTSPAGSDGPTKRAVESERAWTLFNMQSWSQNLQIVAPMCSTSTPDFNTSQFTNAPNVGALLASATVWREGTSGPWTFYPNTIKIEQTYPTRKNTPFPCTYKDGGIPTNPPTIWP